MLVYEKCECFVMHNVVCLCLVCILWQFSMLRSARLAVCQCWSRMQEVTIWKRHTPKLVS